MRAGGGDAPLPPMQLLEDDRTAGVSFSLNGQDYQVRLNRLGPVGGEATVTTNGRVDRYPLREAVVDSYRNWSSDPRYSNVDPGPPLPLHHPGRRSPVTRLSPAVL